MKVKSRLLTGILAIALIFNLGVFALAAQHTEYPHGGTWNWGQEKRSDGIKYAYSNYELTESTAHNTNGVHRTTVVGATTDNSGWVSSGEWAKSSIPCKWNRTERCYYSLQDLEGKELN